MIEGLSPRGPVPGSLESDREAVIASLQEAYADGSLDRAELDRRLEAAMSDVEWGTLTQSDGGATAPRLSKRSRPNARILPGLLAGSGVGLLLLGAVLVNGASHDIGIDDECIATGLSASFGCAPQPQEQQDIEKWAEIAGDATAQTREIVDSGMGGNEATAALGRAESASATANAAARDARAVMVDALGTDPEPGAFDEALENARAAAKEAMQALNEAQAAAEI